MCGSTFERVIGTARKKCFRCSPARITSFPDEGTPQLRAVKDEAQTPEEIRYETSLVPPPNVPHEPGQHEIVVTRELEALGADQTLEGVICVGLATALDDQWLPGAQRTSMAKELKSTMDQIRLGAEPEVKDSTDFWAERAMERARNAGNG